MTQAGIPDSHQSLVVLIPELELAAPDHLVGAVPVMVVRHAPVVDHGGEVGVLVVVGTYSGDISDRMSPCC